MIPSLLRLRERFPWERLQLDRLQVLPPLTVLVLLTSAPEVWYLRTPLVVLCVLGLVYQSLLQAPAFWFTQATLLGGTIYLNWESSDNHKYVIAYWCLVLCCTFTVSPVRREETLALASRWVLGLCMLLAVLWKIGTPQYVDGSFFGYQLLADDRFARFTELMTETSSSMLSDNRELRRLMTGGYERGIELGAVELQTSAGVRTWSLFLTWWTVAIEGLLAAAFLLPDRRSTAWIRNILLITFAVSTYAIAPVRAFGWMLMLLGLAQAEERDRSWRVLYLFAFLLIQIYTLPTAAFMEVVWGW